VTAHFLCRRPEREPALCPFGLGDGPLSASSSSPPALPSRWCC
jgi:hypothetical protein